MSLLQNKLFRKANQVLVDLVIFAFSWVAAFFVRFEGLPPEGNLSQMVFLGFYIFAARAALFYFFSVYSIV